MDDFGAIRARAYEKHCQMRARAGGAGSARALLDAARKAESLSVQSLPPDLPLLGGGDGALHRASKAIYLSNALTSDMAAFVEAHEFGHFWIETPSDPSIVSRGADPGVPEEGSPLGLRRVEAYSAQELRERYANVFGREFLLPRAEARRLFVEEGHAAPKIAEDLGIPIGLVHQQLSSALLLPDLVPDEPVEAAVGDRPGLDDSQKAAAEHEGSPLLVEAGPGTGKTRTLIARIEHLLERGTPAASILALTFSNKAAREIRERVAASMPEAAAEIWAGTFHAFGLEILRKFGHLANVRDPVKLLDQADALALLEEDLADLKLDYYLRLYEPLSDLRYVLSAISRAKDEVKSPDDYLQAAEQMCAAAKSEDEKVKAAKAKEVARVYKYYDERMRREGLVDFADLINRPVEILRNHPEVGEELRGQYQHLLVDEYQDVNRASALLLKELAGDGERLWVVGDARQSIYRFRGAAPINTRDFEIDYPKGRRMPLDVNYRSRKGIVDTFGTYAGAMRVGNGRSVSLGSNRGPGSESLDYNVARDREAEIAGVAAAIRLRHSQGIAYRDQAVLCRVHGDLEKTALGLESLGVPVLYLGDLFERREVTDLLAFLSFAAEPHRGGLFRLATLPTYSALLTDVRAVLAYAAEKDVTPFAVLADIATIPGVTEAGRAGLSRLAGDLAGLGFKTGPGALLCHVLFNRGDLLRQELAGGTAADQQRRLAIYQFLQFAIENDRAEKGDPKKALLDWVRRLEIFGDERALREPPAAVAGIDAVRLMTVHASKGLEFKAVYLPVLGKGKFPKSRQGERCPLPTGLLPTSPADNHDEEEQCLFYVALSRARDHLSLSRAERYSASQRSNSSEALSEIGRHLPRAIDGSPTWNGNLPDRAPEGPRSDLAVAAKDHQGQDIELYLGCPKRYLYQVMLDLSGRRDDNGYVRFHRAVYRVLGWMCLESGNLDPSAITAKLDQAWAEIGPHDHPLAALYRAAAGRILDQARSRSKTGILLNEALKLTLGGHTINVSVDEVEKTSTGVVVLRRLRTGRAPTKPDQRHLHALMLHAGRETLGEPCTFQAQYLTTDDTVPISFDRVMNDRLNDVRTALGDLAAGSFPADPEKLEDCPRCPHYFICPSVPA